MSKLPHPTSLMVDEKRVITPEWYKTLSDLQEANLQAGDLTQIQADLDAAEAAIAAAEQDIDDLEADVADLEDSISGLASAVEHQTGLWPQLIDGMVYGTTSGNATRYVIMRVPVICEAGDVLAVSAHQQFTHTGLFNASIVCYMLLGSTAADTAYSASTLIVDVIGRNVGDEVGQDHDEFSLAGSITVTAAGIYYVNLVAYCYSSAATGEVVNVDEAQGRMSVIRHRPYSTEYTASAVRFDGSDSLSHGSNFPYQADGGSGAFSCWVKFMGGDGAAQTIIENSGSYFTVIRNSSNKIQVIGNNAAGSTILNMTSTTSYTTASGWIHVAASWNLAGVTGYLYINDANDLDTGSDVFTADNIDYTRAGWLVGVKTGGTQYLNAEIADLWFSSQETVVLSTTDVRRRFITSGLKPVDLGKCGAIATRRMPDVFLSDHVDYWHVNRGLASEAFTESGALTAAASSPSD
jgi:hypothetical protein